MGERALMWVTIGLLSATLAVAFVWLADIAAHQNDALSAIVCHAEHVVRKTPGISAKQRHQALHFYQRQVVLEHLKPCS